MNKQPRIILAEDEPSLGQIVKESLVKNGFEVDLCVNGEETLKSYHKASPDILVLDVMMPLKDGFSVAQEIRALDKKTPILFLTAKSQTQDVLEGFSIGGNDYLKKPFSLEELVARIKNLIQRDVSEEPSSISIGLYTFQLKHQTLRYKDDNPISLTHREATLLYYLYQSRNTVLNRSLILNKLWGDDNFFNARSMDVFISKLRKKFQKDPSIQIINVRGFGYKFVI